jgi:hypothetical protein
MLQYVGDTGIAIHCNILQYIAYLLRAFKSAIYIAIYISVSLDIVAIVELQAPDIVAVAEPQAPYVVAVVEPQAPDELAVMVPLIPEREPGTRFVSRKRKFAVVSV